MAKQKLPRGMIGKKVVVIWSGSHERECYGMPTGVITDYDFDKCLYTVEQIEPDGLVTINSYCPEELSTSLLLRSVSKAQQNKIERILRVRSSILRHRKLYYIMCICIGILSTYYLLF